ncbi:origin recognition complex subunit 1 isoform X2 [Ctenocephalides felis]|uniref:origin recognition complex subunit 1 isoform X2 n=1 Tax=Ctenocephalides felis TaxID=7515 RepID=UPI000E6E4822|nr:origin recognition complex subunit 1 isoform X2 [Ctenocephalides felis]
MENDESKIQWVGQVIPSENALIRRFNANCYRSVRYNEMLISVNDYVVIIKENESNSSFDSDVARIKELFEATGGACDDGKYRAIVEWYSRPRDLEKFCKDVEMDPENEVVLDLRPFDDNVSIESIHVKCNVLLSKADDDPGGLVKGTKKKVTTYVCRYALIRKYNQVKFVLAPVLDYLQGVFDVKDKISTPTSSNSGEPRKSTPRRTNRERSSSSYNYLSYKSMSTINEPEVVKTPTRGRKAILNNISTNNSPRTPRRRSLLIDVLSTPRIPETPKRTRTPKQNENRENKTEQQWSIKRKSTSQIIKDITNKDPNMSPEIPIVSPIKLINKSILSKVNENKTLTERDISQELDSDDEPLQLNIKKIGARRNLNDSLQCFSDDMDTDDCAPQVQYSVVLDKNEPNKIKLRVSDDSIRNKSCIQDVAYDSFQSSEESISSLNSDYDNLNLKASIVKLQKMNLEEVKRNIDKQIKSKTNEKVVRSSSRSRKINSRYSNDYDSSPTKVSASSKSRVKRNAKADNSKDDEMEVVTNLSTPVKSRKIEELHVTPKHAKKSEPKTPCTTPGIRLKQFKSGNMTPTLQLRDAPSTPSSGLSLARERLHVSAVPKSLPCRETEFNDIFTFVQGKLLDNSGGCMYISGVPGTGKTATVTEVIKCLQKLSKEKKLPKFEFIEVNGMRLTEPRQTYVHIYRQMEGKTVPWEQALSALDKKFTTSAKSRLSTVLLVDELDILCTKRQDVVYTILDWPSKANAKLIVITIANTMDLPERLLRAKVTSRLGLTRRTFAPYSHKQLMDIVMSRLYGIDLFNSDAVQLVARKVAAVSGDARRALDICRRATEIAEFTESSNKSKNSNGAAIVSMVHVNQALSEMITSAKVTAIQNCSTMEKIFLQAVAAEVARTGVEETTFGCCYQHVSSLCALEGLQNLATSTALSICCRLGSRRLLITETGRSDLNMKILLNVGSDDLHYALQEV